MFNNLGTGEIIIVAVVLMIFFGGKKLPELARGIGEASREFRKALNGEVKTTAESKPKSKK